jgi:two-component system alkaline phosphatase synthesis response regulator PhoP
MPKVLMIDDDNDLLEITKNLLDKKGYEVAGFNNWEEALINIDTFEPQLIVLDVFLNDTDGLEICKNLKAMPRTKHIPVLIFSSYPGIAERVIYEYGADGFIEKPFEVDDLIAKMHSVLSQTAGLA